MSEPAAVEIRADETPAEYSPAEHTPAEHTDQRTLLTSLAELVLSVSSVVRLEPTVRNRLRQLSEHPVSTIGSAAPAPDGVACKRVGGQLDVSVEVAAIPDRPAAEVAEEIQRRVRDQVLGSGWEPGSVSVSVLALERVPELPTV